MTELTDITNASDLSILYDLKMVDQFYNVTTQNNYNSLWKKYINDAQEKEIGEIIDKIVQARDIKFRTGGYVDNMKLIDASDEYYNNNSDEGKTARVRFILVMQQTIDKHEDIFRENYAKIIDIKRDRIHYEQETINLFSETIRINLSIIKLLKSARNGMMNRVYT